ncbi:unnamed protein product [Symbiodinium sp. CCMP2456]|nr:unnamed protein product [Symbiodinium sp. CCMP2456]
MARTPASRNIGRVLALLALFWACQPTVQTVHTAVGARAVPFARPPAGAWARKPLIARRATSKADGQHSEADDKEDDEVSKLAKEHDEVQSYDADEVLRWVRQVSRPKDIDEFVTQEYIGETLLEKSAAELDRKLKLPDGPRERLVKHIKKLKAAAAVRDFKKKLEDEGADEDRITMVGDMLSALVKLDAKTVMSSALEDPDVQSVLEQACNATRDDVNSYEPLQVAAWIAANLVSAKYDASAIQQALAKLTGMLPRQLLEVTQGELESRYNLEAAKAKFLFNAVQDLSDPLVLTFRDLVNDSSYPEFQYKRVWVYRLLTDIPECGYIEDAQLLTSTVGGEVVDVAIGSRKGKRCIPVFYGESGSGKTLQSQLAPALKLGNNSCIVRVFSKTLDDDDPILENIRHEHAQENWQKRNALCKNWTLTMLFAQIKSAFWPHDEVVEAWLGNSSRNKQDLGTIVFVIDEVSKCIELARGISATQTDIYTTLEQKYCLSAQLVMAGTAAAYILGTPGTSVLSTDPKKVCLTHVGLVQGSKYLGRLLTQLDNQTGVHLKDLQVASVRPYLSNARTAWFLIETLRCFFSWAPKDVSRKMAGSIWKRYPAATGCYVPLMYRTTNGLQRLKTAEEREGIANRALKLLMHADLLTPDTMPTLREAVECVSLGLCNVSNYSQAQSLLAQDGQSKTYRDDLIFQSSPALAHMLLAAFDVPEVVPHQDGDSLEAVIMEAERRFSEVLTGRKAIALTLPHALPPQLNQQNMTGLPLEQFKEILAALKSSQTVVLRNGPSAQGADIIVLRRKHGSNMPLVRLIQAKNKNKKADMLPAISTLGVTCSNKTVTCRAWHRAAQVLGWLCRLVSEQAGRNAFELGKFKQPRTNVSVSVELVLWESIPRNEAPPTLSRPKFLQQTPTFRLRSLQHLAPFPTHIARPDSKYVAQKQWPKKRRSGKPPAKKSSASKR